MLGSANTDERTWDDPDSVDFEREGISVWRKLTAGVGYDDPHTFPFKVTLAFFAAELSARPLDRIGYRGGMLRFDVPLKVPSH